MSYSKAQIIDAALRVANMTGGDANSSPVIDSAVVLEDLFYNAIHQSVVEGSQKAAEVGGLKRDFTIVITNGVGTMPDDAIDECMNDSNVYSTTDNDISDLMSFQPRYFDYIRDGFSQLGYYTVQGPSFLMKEPGGSINSFNGTIHLVAVAIPDLSGAITAAITIPSDTAERTILILASMLKGAAKSA